MSINSMTQTLIAVYKSTANDLKKFKITKTESYDEIINRMMEHFNGDGKLKRDKQRK